MSRLRALLPLLLAAAPAAAQISTDGSLGPAVSLPLVGGEYSITDDLGRYAGENLFQSFSTFDVGVGETATFLASLGDPARVIARVTAGDGTRIAGTLRSAIPGADLFLLDSRGVAFAPGAQLEVDGSFYASSADVVRFESGPDFPTADASPDPLLSAAAPAAFGFTSASPAPVSLSETASQPSVLSVPAGETLSLVGGRVSLTGPVGSTSPIIDAPGARVEIASAAGPIDVPVALADLDLETADPSALGSVELFSAIVDVSGDAEVPSGSLMIRGGEFVLARGSQLLAENTSDLAAAGTIDVAVSDGLRVLGWQPPQMQDEPQTRIRSASESAGDAGDVLLQGDVVQVVGGGRVELEGSGAGAAPDATISGRVVAIAGGGVVQAESGSTSSASQITLAATEEVAIDSGGAVGAALLAGHSGTPGGIALDAPEVSVQGDAVVSSLNASPGAGPSVDIDAHRFRVSNAYVIANDGGPIGVTADRVELLEGGEVITRALADKPAGALSVVADSVLASGEDGNEPSGLFSRARENASPTGVGGLLSVDTRILEVENGASVSSATFGAADAGNVDIDASQRVTVSGGTNGFSQISAAARLGSSGNGGSIDIDTGLLELRDGGQVSTTTNGAGHGGRIDAHADRIEISGVDPLTGKNEAGFFSNSNTANVVSGGDGGSIHLVATDRVRISDGGIVEAEATGQGLAGDIEIDGGRRIEIENATVTSRSVASAGGNVKLTADGLVYLLDAAVTTDVLGGAGGGGDVTVDPTNTVLNRSQITARAVQGPGGNILIVTDYYFQSGESFLDASSELGIDGTEEVTSPDTDLTGGLATLPATYLDASARLERDCAARTERAGSFTVRSRAALPAPPDALLPPPDAASCEEEEP